ncbi:hypothetical protein J4455_04620 [Candidatus Woesearchaeota archaeon]|nr:hypothetical protein [Candidatus Woesearchaeota archaeon]
MKKEIFILLIISLFVISSCKNFYAKDTSKGAEELDKEMEDNCKNDCSIEGNFCTGNSLYKCFRAGESKCLSADLIKECSSNEKCTINGCEEKKVPQLSKNFDLKDYPEPFILNAKFNDYALVVSTSGLNGEIIVGADIQSGLVPYVNEKFPSPYTTRQISSVEGKNVILIGNPCTNKLIAEVKNIEFKSSNCDAFINDGETILELYDSLDDKHVILLVMAKNDNDYKKAGLFLKYWEEHKDKFKGNKLVIT